MIIHNPIISGSIQFPADADGNKVTLQVNSGVLETIQIDSSNNATAVKPESNLSGSFTGSFQGDGSALTGVSAINIDALGSLGGASIAQGDNLVISDSGTEKKVTFSNLEDSVFGNVSGDITIAAGGASTLASIANSKLANSSITIDGSAISLGGSVTTTNTQLSTEAVQDIAGALVATGGTKTGIAVTYDDDNANMDFVVTFPSQTDENFTTADHSKLNAIEASADVTDTTNVTAAGALMDSELTDLAGVKGVTISTLQAKPSEGAFANGDKTKLDTIASSANNYVLPTNLDGDDIDIDTTPLTGATVISDLDINITTNTSGLVTDANGTVVTRELTKGDIGLGNVDNDSTSTIQAGTTKANVGLGNVDNTTDALKPVSTAGQTALNLKANLASPSLTGNPTAPTQADNDDSTKIATTAYVQREVSDLLGGAPAAFDTLLEISASIANGDSDVVALTTTVGTKLAKSSNLSDLANTGTARTNLGLVIGTNVQAFNSTLGTVAGGTYSGDNSIVTIGTVTTGNVQAILPGGVVSGSDQVNALASDVNNNTITFTAGAGLDGGAAITLNQSSDETVTFTVSDGVVSGSDQIASTFAQTILDDTSAGAVRTTIGVDAAGTDNSTDVTLAGRDYLTVSGQEITAGTINNDDLANSAITIDGSAISLGGSVTTTNTQLSQEQVQDFVGGMLGGTETGITVTYQDGTNDIDFVVASQTENDFTTVLKNKLDNIEGTADVTDTTNVTAAGALMDSEVTNLADVKSFDTSDYATSAQGTKADAALPKGGGAMTGAITTNSTFDGRDVATDGTKLDTIESSADVTDTANVTSAGALMDSELSSISDIKALNQSVVSGATPTFTVTNFSDVSNKRFMSDAQETLLNSVETNADVTDTANVKSSLNASLGGSANIGDGSDTITIPGDLVVTGTTTTENVTTLTTSNGIVFEGSVADEHEATLKAGTLSADRTLTLPNATGTIALTSDLATVGAGGLTQQNFTTTLKNKLDGIEGSATADQSNAEIRAAVEAASDSNVFTDTDHSKLNAIEASADVTDTTNVTSAGALMDSEVTNLSQVKAFDSSDYLASSVTTISGGQASAITANTAKTGITSGQASAITANTAKTSDINHNVSTNLSEGTSTTTTVDVNSSDGNNATLVSASTSRAGLLTKAKFDEIVANSLKTSDINHNVSTDLGISGTSGARTITSSDGNNAVIPIATTSVSGLLSPGLFDEIDANTAKTSDINHNVSTNLSKTTSTTNVTINSSDGDNIAIGAASTSVAGVMTKSMFDKLDGIASSANNYVLPTNFAGDDFSLDTGALTGATIVSDIDINITTDTSGRVSDANGTVATRELTLANLGYTGDTDATNDQTATEIRSLVGTGNSGVVPSIGTAGHFLKHDGTFGLPSYTTNTDVSVSAANFKSRLAGGYAGNAAQIGDSGDTITIPGDLVVTGTTTTNNVETVSTSNGVVFEGNAADDNEITLLAATVSADRTITLPNASGTVALTSNIITNNNQITNGEGYISSFDITAQTDSKYLRSNANDTATGIISITNSTASTSKTTGALKVTGGVGISGALNVGGDVVAFASSDERLKDNIELISNPIEKVQSLRGVTWDWNSNADILQQTLPNVGVIAQDVEKVLPQLVIDRDNGFKGVDYAKLTGLLIEAVKDQQKQIDELKSKLS